jgi:hypothetical protein
LPTVAANDDVSDSEQWSAAPPGKKCSALKNALPYADVGIARHLLRRCEILITDHPHSRFAPQVQTIFRAALAVRARRATGLISEHGVAVARGRFAHQLDRLLETPKQWGGRTNGLGQLSESGAIEPTVGAGNGSENVATWSSGARCAVASSSTESSSCHDIPLRPGTVRAAPAR